MAGMTNRGKKVRDDYYFRRQGTLPTNFYVMLFTAAIAPGPDVNLVSDLTEIPAGNGYTSGGYQLSPNTTDFDLLTEDDANDKSIMQVKDVIYTASGGNLPASGSGARYAGLTDDNATIANRVIFFFWDLVSNRIVSVGQSLTLQNLEMQETE